MKRLLFVFLVMVMLFACLTVANAANSYRLVLPSTKIPAQLSERKLSDDEVAQLLNADLQTMRERISTYADYIALVECNEAFYYESLVSDDKESVDIGGEYTRAWMGNLFAPNMSAGLAYYVLQDDYPGMKVVVAYYMQGDAGSAAQLRYGSVIPVEDGYIVLSAESFAKNAQENAGVAAKAIQTAHVQELGGGHVINYIKNDEAYYVFDLYSWACNDFTGAGLGCSRDSDLNKATIGWSYNLGMQDTIKCMYTYTNPRSGDAPVGWSNVDWGVSYLIKDYAEDVNIVLETPDEGYVYEFVDVNENVYSAIEYSRRAW